MVDDCTPAGRVTKSLLGYGVIAGPCYVLGSVVHGLLTPGFSFSHDSWSLLSTGSHGWVHVVVFIVTGLMVAAAGVGFRRHDRGVTGIALIAYGVLLVVAGLARPDRPGVGASVHGVVHLAAGGLGFVAFAVAAFSAAVRFKRRRRAGWAAWSVVAGAALLIGFVGIASGSSTAAIVWGFTAAVVISWVWLATASVRYYRDAALENRVEAGSRADVEGLKPASRMR